MRKGVIIAAGNGSRLCRLDGQPKPLIKVAGVPLIERVILTGKRSGLDHFVVVLGFKGEEIQRYLEAHRERLGVSIEYAWNRDWSKPNGFSVLQAEPLVEDEFVLMMSDHIVETSGLEKFLKNTPEEGEVLLAVDPRLEDVFDMEDATKVLQEDGKIQKIGKEIDTYNAVDTGFFLCSRGIFEALRQACREGKGSLTEAIQILARQGKARTIALGDFFWQDVDSPQTLAYAEKRLFQWVAKAKSTDGLVSRHLNRKVSGFLSRWLVKTPVTPNQVTYSALFFGLLSAFLISRGDYGHVLWGGILFQFCSIYDGCDGEVAKLKMRSTKRGEWLDTFADNITYVAFFIGVVCGLHRQGASPLFISLGMITVVGVILTLGLMYLYLRRYSNSGSLVAVQVDFLQDLKQNNSFFLRLVGFLCPFAKRDCFALFFMVFACLNRLDWILLATFVASQLMWISLLTMKKSVSDALAPAHSLQED